MWVCAPNYYIQPQMEDPSTCTQIIPNINKLPLTVLANIVSYLDPQTIEAVHGQIRPNSLNQHPFYSLISAYAFLNKYIYRTDRSIYLSFYGDKFFLSNERLTVTKTSSQSAHHYYRSYWLFNRLFATFQKQLSPLESAPQILDLLINCMTDPQLPFPKMRKEGIAIHCNSSFQFFLADLHFPSLSEPFTEEVVEDLQEFLKQQKAQQIKIVEGSQHEKLRRVIQTMEYLPQEITCENFHHYLIEDFPAHNLCVLLLALVDNLLQGYKKYILSFENTYDQFIEFVMRYCIFRNIVLDLEEKFGFLPTLVKSILEEGLQTQRKRQFNLWKTLLSKWHCIMSEFHQSNTQIFIYMLDKVRTKNLQENIPRLFQERPNVMISIQNRIEVNRFSVEEHKLVKDREFSEVEQYFEDNPDLFEQILRQYSQYMVDISVNPITVHWCGHTQQQLSPPFLQFQSILCRYNFAYFRHLAKILNSKTTPTESTISYLLEIYTQQIDFLENSLIKSSTLKQMTSEANKLLKRLSGSETELIQINLEEKNKMLQYYNSQARIPQDMDEEKRKQFEIGMSISVKDSINQCLKFSSETNDTEGQMEDPSKQQVI